MTISSVLIGRPIMDGFRWLFIVVLLVFGVSCGGGGSSDGGTGPVTPPPDPGAFRFQILEPEDPDISFAEGFVADVEGFLEPSVEFVNSVAPLHESNDIPIYFTVCDSAGASFNRSLSEIEMCYELWELFFVQYANIFADIEDEEDRLAVSYASAFSAFNFVLYHEVGHALHFTLDLGIAGNQESAADAIATVLAVEQDRSIFPILAALLLLSDDDSSFGDVHPGGLDRGGDVLCWTLGGDPDLASDPAFGSLVNLFVEARRDCVGEYGAQQFAVFGWLPLLEEQTTIALDTRRNASPSLSLNSMDTSTKRQLSDLLAGLVVGRI